MASTLRKLTGMGGDVRKIAALLQAKAPAGHKLAYINDEEAALLKSRGGSGKPHADTGIPSYQDDSLSSEMYQDYGLKLSGIGDNIALGAIKTGLQADQYVQQLTNNYFTNIARTAYGAAPQVTSDYRYQTERTA